ncbi:hypothetical protein B0184_08795 [Haemophilus paraphrohaemolyticus]|nr:hypothetical protein B0184_08795 [Haemophilus paraphrohaemolyticus]
MLRKVYPWVSFLIKNSIYMQDFCVSMQKKQFIPLTFSVKKIIILQKLDLDYIFNGTNPPY